MSQSPEVFEDLPKQTWPNKDQQSSPELLTGKIVQRWTLYREYLLLLNPILKNMLRQKLQRQRS